MKLKSVIIVIITLIVIACCVSFCAEKVQAQNKKQWFTITRVHWDAMHDLKIYKVTTPTGISYVLRDADQGGLCTLK